MSLYESEVEWLNEVEEDYCDIKQAVFSGEEFEAYIAEVGMVNTLRTVSEFHKMLTAQLKAQGVTSPDHSDWARRTIGLVVRVKARRQQLRTAIRNNYENGSEIVDRIREEVENDWLD